MESATHDWKHNADVEEMLREVLPLLADTYIDVQSMMTTQRPLNLTSFVTHGIQVIMRGLMNELLADDPWDSRDANSVGGRFSKMLDQLTTTAKKLFHTSSLDNIAVIGGSVAGKGRPVSPPEPTVTPKLVIHYGDSVSDQTEPGKSQEKKDGSEVQVARMYRRISGITDEKRIKRFVDAWVRLDHQTTLPEVYARPSYRGDEAKQYEQACEWIRALHELIEQLSLQGYVTDVFFQKLEKTDELLKKANA